MRSKFKNIKNKKALSPIISAILLLVIGIILILVILSWGKNFSISSLGTTKQVFSKLSAAGMLQTTSEGSNLVVKNLYQIPLTFNRYEILGDSSDNPFANQVIFFKDPVTISAGNIGIISFACIPSRQFKVNFITEDNQYVSETINVKGFAQNTCSPELLGTGTSSDPFKIYNVFQLNDVRNHLDSEEQIYFSLENDLDFGLFDKSIFDDHSGFEDYATNGWLPIGTDTDSFSGNFNGNNHTISNLYINRPDTDYVGLFGNVSEKVFDLQLKDVNITGNSYVGSLAGNNAGYLKNNTVTGEVTGGENIGGFVGYNNVKGDLYYNSFEGSVTGNTNVGGFVGYSYLSNIISNNFAISDVNGSENVGGFIGYNNGNLVNYTIFILNNYSTGSVDGENNIGGFIGYNKGDIYNSFSASVVTGDVNIGSFVGLNEGTIHNSYYDSDVSFIDGENKGIPKTTSEMKTAETYENWNFGGGGWELIPGNYPSFKELSVNPPLNKSSDGYFEINYLEDLVLINKYPNANYKLIRDLDFNDSSSYKSGTINTDWISNDGWIPISRPDYSIFRGNFNGQNHTIKNLYINQPNSIILGFFDVLGSGSRINNLVLEDYNVIGYRYVGSLLGYNFNSVLSHNSVSGMVFGNQNVIGGLVGYQNYGSIFDCNSESVVSGNSNVGGITGANNGFISNCFSNSEVTANVYGGGIIGRNYSSLYYSFSTGTITGGNLVGGLVGENKGVISDCGSSANVFGLSSVGGLSGYNAIDSIISNSYATGNAVGSGNFVGGLIGRSYGHIYNDYATGNVEGANYLGGLVGICYDGNLLNNYATGNVVGSGNYVGGLIGQSSNKSNLFFNYSTGDVTGINQVGGFAGRSDSFVDQCYSTGNVSGVVDVGGFIGNIYNYENTKVSNSYSLGDVYRSSGTSANFGGFVGRNYVNITNSYSTGKVYGDSWTPTDKGFIGVVYSADINNFFDSETSLQTTTAGNALAKTTTEMKTQDTFTGWDFENVWAINPSKNNGYPYQRWQD